LPILYLDLLKRALLNELGLENELRIAYLQSCIAASIVPDPIHLHDIRFADADGFSALMQSRLAGRFPSPGTAPGYGHTMIGRDRLDQLHDCLDRVTEDDIPGDLLEAGVWRGGACIFMRGYLKAHNISDRTVWLADSFRGLPEAEAKAHGVDPVLNNHLAVSAATVRDAFERYGLWDEQVTLVEGWFADTLPTLPAERLAVLRLDGDLFGSTIAGLASLYPRVAPGGFVIIDDYFAVGGCRAAVDAFRARQGITAPMERIDWTGMVWRKPA
jgi:O-methyltransferase